MKALVVVLYLIATGLLVGAGWFARAAEVVWPVVAVGAFHVAIGALIARRFFGRGGQ